MFWDSLIRTDFKTLRGDYLTKFSLDSVEESRVLLNRAKTNSCTRYTASKGGLYELHMPQQYNRVKVTHRSQKLNLRNYEI